MAAPLGHKVPVVMAVGAVILELSRVVDAYLIAFAGLTGAVAVPVTVAASGVTPSMLLLVLTVAAALVNVTAVRRAIPALAPGVLRAVGRGVPTPVAVIRAMPRVQVVEAEAQDRRLPLVRLEAVAVVAVEGTWPHQLIRAIPARRQIRRLLTHSRSPPEAHSRFPLVLRADKL